MEVVFQLTGMLGLDYLHFNSNYRLVAGKLYLSLKLRGYFQPQLTFLPRQHSSLQNIYY